MFTPDYLHSLTGIHQSLLHKMSLLNITVESSFKLQANPNSKKSSAFGLMQVTDKTRGDVINLKDNVLDLERADLEDPIISIAMGIRWLSYKYSAKPKNND